MMLDALIDEAAISLDAVLPHRKAVIALAADLIAPIAGTTYDDARSVLSAREALGSTAIGHGVALPHGRSPSCQQPAIALIRLANCIRYGAPDHDVVDIVVAILWPSQEDSPFRKVAAEFCRLLRSPDILGSIRRADTAADIRIILKRRLPLLASPVHDLHRINLETP